MSFFAPKVEAPAGLANNTPGRSATLSPSEVYPLVRGRGRVVARPITPVLHWQFRNTERSSYAFFTCLYGLCLGPVDEFAQLIVNGKAYNGVFKHRDENPGDFVTHVISKETPERFWLGWGTEDQGNQTALIQSVIRDAAHPMATKVHPNRKGIAWMLVQDMEAGSSLGGKTPPLPKIEVEVHCRGVTTYSFGHAPHGAHPIGTIRDILTLKRGCLGLPAGYFDAAHWTAQTNKLYNTGLAGIAGTDLWTSHILDKPRSASDVIADVASYFDGHIRERDGKLQVDWQPNDGSTSSPTGLREISLHEMADEPSLEPEDLEQLATQVIVTGLDWQSDPPLSEASETAQVPYSRRLIGEARTVQVNRPGWCDRSQIKSAATIEAATRANPSLKVRVPVLRQYAVHADGLTPLRPGDRFTLDWAPVGLDVVVRILERSKETPTRVEFYVQVERGAFPRPYEPALDARASIEPPLPPALVRYAAAQLPPALSESPAVALLVERPSTNVSGAELHFAPTNSWPGQVLGNVSTWSVGAVLAAALPDADDDVTVSVNTVGLDWLYLASQSALQQSDDALLMYRAGEWCSVGTITPTGGGSYTVALKRARLGSESAAHAEGAVVFFAFRSQLVAWKHASFLAIQVAGEYDPTTATKWFKLRPYNSAGQGPLSDPFSLQLRNWWGEAPLIEIGALPGGAVTGVAYTLSGAIIDLSGDLDSFDVRLVRFDGADVVGEFTALARAALDAERTELEWSAPVVFPIAGTWRVVVRARDLATNTVDESSAPFTVAAGTTVDQVRNMLDDVSRDLALVRRAASDHATGIIREVERRAAQVTQLGADIVEESTLREDADAALAETITTTSAALSAAISAAVAAATSSSVTRDEAISRDLALMWSRLNGAFSALARESEVRSTNELAQARDLVLLRASIGQAMASLHREYQVRATQTEALSSSVLTLEAGLGTANSNITAANVARAAGDEALAASQTTLSATVGALSSNVSILAAAYIKDGVAVASWGFKLDGAGKIVSMQATAASGGVIGEVGEFVFGGANLRSDNFAESGGVPTGGWKLGYDGVIRAKGALLRDADIVGTLRVGTIFEAGLGVPVAEAPAPTLTPQSSPTIRMSSPGSPPDGWAVWYRIGAGAIEGPLTAFPVDLTPATAATRVLIWATAPGRSQSGIIDTSYNDLTL